ncbi:MAG: DUF3141 domain-containing protein, partial [Phycisphaerales bacterium]|nr:DUF3141 domain-containing protein [Phycisphaerales bacterium]
FYFLSREEILAIVDNLFVGNRLEEGTLRICPGCHVDLRRIRSPLVIFASRGDHITPPQQALGWLSAVYADTAALKQAGQRIVYLINDRIGHLGLFVSAAVARREHRAIVDSLPAIDSLVPGLYEMHIDDRTGEPGCGEPGYRVRFEEREIEDVTFPVARREFERARRASELYDSAYRAFLSPWVQASASPWSAAAWQWLHPMRTSRYLFSPTFNPCMAGVRMLATAVAAQRRPLPGSHPFVRLERESCDEAMGMIAAARKWRDALYEHTFSLLYGA